MDALYENLETTWYIGDEEGNCLLKETDDITKVKTELRKFRASKKTQSARAFRVERYVSEFEETF